MMNQHGINHLPVIGAQDQVVAVLDRKEIDAQILLSTPHMGEAERHFVEEAFGPVLVEHPLGEFFVHRETFGNMNIP